MKKLLLLSLFATIALPTFAQNPWPLERQDRWATGQARSGPNPAYFSEPWVSKVLSMNLPVSHGPSLGANNIGYYGNWVENKVHKFNYATGTIISSFQASGFVTSTPAIGGSNRVFAGQDGWVTAINSTNMSWLWRNTTAYISSSVNLGPDGDLMYATSGGVVNRVDPDTGMAQWTRTGYGSPKGQVVFTRDDARIVFSNGINVTALNYADGTNGWTRPLSATAGAVGVAPNGTLVVGDDSGMVRALNPANGNVLWFYQTSGEVRGGPGFSLDGTKVYVPSYDQNMYCFDLATGAFQWAYDSDMWNEFAPSVGFDGRIYFQNKAGILTALQPNGQKIWSMNLGGEARGPLSIGPDGTLYCGFTGNNLSGLAIVKQAVFLSSFGITPGVVPAGGGATGVVKLDGPAPIGGALVTITPNSTILQTPPNMTIPVGGLNGTFKIYVLGTATTVTRTITTSYHGVSKTAAVTIVPSTSVLSLVLSPNTVTGGNNVAARVTIASPAPPGGAVVTVESGSSVITVPPTVTVPAGQTYALFNVGTLAVTQQVTRSVKATSNGVSKIAYLTITPP